MSERLTHDYPQASQDLMMALGSQTCIHFLAYWGFSTANGHCFDLEA